MAITYKCNSKLPNIKNINSSSIDKHLAIDIHCHIYFPKAAELVSEAFDLNSDFLYKFSNEETRNVNIKQEDTINTLITSIEARLSEMDKMNIDIQALSIAPIQYYYALDPDLTYASSQLINNSIMEITNKYPERFVGLATIPMQEPALAVKELRRAVNELGMKGVEICTSVNGTDLSDEKYNIFFSEAEKLGILIFMHPSGFSNGDRLSDHYFSNVIGNPLDSTIAISHLIFGGVLDKYPKLKICVAHGGGYLPSYSGRIDHAHNARSDCRRCIEKEPTTYLKKLYFDTVVFTKHQLEYLISLYGSDHLLLGTDYPYDMGMYTPVDFINSIESLSNEEKKMIIGGNAAELLNLF
jgi:aminocarboxymuconate-semialdehyde decarboxylase|tara:strand:+ start:20372 stop:21436 length:1065 start_codon:yes stop_codon:yes gene_type:complete